MSLDDSMKDAWAAMQQRRRQTEGDAAGAELPLYGGSGGGTYDGMDGRVSKLEAYMEVARDDLREIKRDLGTIKDSFGQLATKSDMVTWKWQWVAVAIGLISLAITGMAGGLALVAYILTPHQ